MSKLTSLTIRATENGFLIGEDSINRMTPTIGKEWSFETFGGMSKFLKQNMKQPIKKTTPEDGL